MVPTDPNCHFKLIYGLRIRNGPSKHDLFYDFNLTYASMLTCMVSILLSDGNVENEAGMEAIILSPNIGFGVSKYHFQPIYTIYRHLWVLWVSKNEFCPKLDILSRI